MSDKGCREEPDPAASPRPPGEIRRGGAGGGVLFAPCPDCAQFGSSHPAGSLQGRSDPRTGCGRAARKGAPSVGFRRRDYARMSGTRPG